jgi:hypothetical protein
MVAQHGVGELRVVIGDKKNKKQLLSYGKLGLLD